MVKRPARYVLVILPLLGIATLGCQPPADTPSTPPGQADAMDRHATGTFDVDLTPQESRETPEGSELGRTIIAKRFHGDIQGTGSGQMLTALSAVEGSAGYVAIEEVRGTVHGLEGSFLLQHNGLMDRGAQQLTITVVPDSGTGELEGIAGTMTLSLGDGTRAYQLTYRLQGDG